MTRLYTKQGEAFPRAFFRKDDDFGVEVIQLVRPHLRFWASEHGVPELIVKDDPHHLQAHPSPSELLSELPDDDNIQAQTRRSRSRLFAWFLLAEDPHRRLDAREIATLAHQATLVEYVRTRVDTQRVLIADEVGLGKTVEAGLIIQGLLEAEPGLRILYFAPASLARNVKREFDRLGLGFRLWVAGDDRTAELSDPLIVASIHRAVHPRHREAILKATPPDVLIVDEAHHLSDWAEGGGSPTQKYALIRDLIAASGPKLKVYLLTGTPHQGSPIRFKNLLRLIAQPNEPPEEAKGRVIYRIKDDVKDWDGKPLFPDRDVRPPTVVNLGEGYRQWLISIRDLFTQSKQESQAKERAGAWRAAMALQWATSSPQAGLGFLVRQAIRAGWTHEQPVLNNSLRALRPYRRGPREEDVDALFRRIYREIEVNRRDAEIEDIESDLEGEASLVWKPDSEKLAGCLELGLEMVRTQANTKWDELFDNVVSGLGDEKLVMFAQPVETVTALAEYIRERFGTDAALIIGSQKMPERDAEIRRFQKPEGSQFLVASRAGAEGFNLQVARRLVHLDVPWNPMELEQRVGRVHRFGSRRTIIVDMLVVKDSREQDAYDKAREKLRTIASSLTTDSQRFDTLYARVMSLVRPDELEHIMGEGAVGPLTDEETQRLGELVSESFRRWKEFDDESRAGREQLLQLEAGQATWEDLYDWARAELDGEPRDGFYRLGFDRIGTELVESEKAVKVLQIDGTLHAFGETHGMPVIDQEDRQASLFGLNHPRARQALRRAISPRFPTGAMQVTWPESKAFPLPTSRPCGAVTVVRQTLKAVSATAFEEHRLELRTVVVDVRGRRVELEPEDQAQFIRGLREASVKAKRSEHPELPGQLREEERCFLKGLRQLTEEERAQGLRPVVWPLACVLVE